MIALCRRTREWKESVESSSTLPSLAAISKCCFQQWEWFLTMVSSFQMWQFAPNSVHYLLSLWQRMVASVPYIKATEPHMLETYTPEVTKAYITSRLDSVAVILRWTTKCTDRSPAVDPKHPIVRFVVSSAPKLIGGVFFFMFCCRDGLEDPLEDHAMVSQQFDQVIFLISICLTASSEQCLCGQSFYEYTIRQIGPRACWVNSVRTTKRQTDRRGHTWAEPENYPVLRKKKIMPSCRLSHS